MLAEAYPHVRKVYLAIGYTDYPRSIVIREDRCEKAHHNNLLTDNSDNDIID